MIVIRDFQQVRNLKVGARAYVWIETEAKQDATILPLGSVLARGQDFFAFLGRGALWARWVSTDGANG